LQAGITTFNIDNNRSQASSNLSGSNISGNNGQRQSIVSKSCISMLNDNVNSEFAGYSDRTSIIGDANNNNHDCIMDDIDSMSEERNEKFHKFRKFIKRRIASTKFKNIQIEMLYQRYLLRMNQNNAAHVVWLLFSLILILTVIHANFFVKRLNDVKMCKLLDETNSTNLNEATNSSYLDVNETTTMPATLTYDFIDQQNCQQNVTTTYELMSTANFIQFMLLALCSVLYIILLLCLHKQRINEIYLFHVSYAIIISLVIIDISFSITNMGR
jgi:hypothetical protein